MELWCCKLSDFSDSNLCPSGMAAIATLMELFGPGDHLIVDSDLYGGPFVCLITSTKKGIEITKLDDFVENLEGRIKPNTKAIYIEIPTNPMMNVTDIKAISKITRARGFGAMVTFEVCSREFARCILKNVKLIQFAESLGGVETLITYPKSEI